MASAAIAVMENPLFQFAKLGWKIKRRNFESVRKLDNVNWSAKERKSSGKRKKGCARRSGSATRFFGIINIWLS